MKAKRIMFLFLCVLSLLIFTNAAQSDVVTDRLNATLDAYIAAPWPNPLDMNYPDSAILGKCGYALASLYRGVNITTARTYANNVCDYSVISGTNDAFTTYFMLPSVWRMYLDPTCYNNLDAATRTNILDAMWDWVYQRSLYSDAQISVWKIYSTENHDIIHKGSYMLCLQALKKAGYPHGTTLADTHTVDEHLAAWKKHFYEYFRQRAREGLSCEITSPTYVKYYLSNLYNIRDLSSDANLCTLAGKFLDLYWADWAQDFMPSTAIRGASGNRWYQDELDFLPEPWPCAYDWADVSPGIIHPYSMNPFTSSYRPPAIVNAIASRPAKTPYLTTSRRFGKGYADTYGNEVTFDPNNCSNARRDTYWTPYYTMGSLSLATSSNQYTAIFNQSRAMGIFLSNDDQDRIIIDGNGTGHTADGSTGYAELTGVCGARCLVASWDKNATSNEGMSIYLSNGGMLSHKTDDASGWIFTSTYGHRFVADAADDPTRNNELRLGDPAVDPVVGWYVPSLTTGNGGQGGTGEALVFTKSGNDAWGFYGDEAFAKNGWSYFYDSVALDFWFKANTAADANNQILINAPDVWSVAINGANASFTVNGPTIARTLTITGVVNPANWQHVVASSDATGYTTFTVDSTPATPSSGQAIVKKTADIVLGNKPGRTRFYQGKIDTVSIKIPSQSNKLVASWNMDSSYSKDVYIAMRIAQGGYTLRSSTMNGSVMCLGDYKNSPVVFEVATVNEYADLTAFQNAVKSTSPRRWYWDANSTKKHLTYTSLAGDTYEYWANSATLPKKNGANVNLNPNKSFDGPYLNGNHGMDTMTISYPGFTDVTLDFSYSTSPQWDDYQTVALWHMDNLVSGKVPDDDLENPTRNKDLTLSGAVLTTGNGGKFGEGLSFDGVNDSATYTNGFSSNTAKIDIWVYPTDTSGINVVATARNIWNIELTNGTLNMSTWHSGYSGFMPTGITGVSANNWHHIVATIDSTGHRTLACDSSTVSDQPISTGLLTTTTSIDVGNKSGTTRWFNGKIDELKISKYSTP